MWSSHAPGLVMEDCFFFTDEIMDSVLWKRTTQLVNVLMDFFCVCFLLLYDYFSICFLIFCRDFLSVVSKEPNKRGNEHLLSLSFP